MLSQTRASGFSHATHWIRRFACGTFLALGLWQAAPIVASAQAHSKASDPWAAFRIPEFDHVTVREGLPDPTVTAIAQDSRGFIWVGTFGGLARYDGHRTIVVEADGANVSELPDGYVRSIVALPGGDILVALDAGGVTRVDGRTQRVRRYPFDRPGTPSARVYQLALSRAGRPWVASERGLYRLEPVTGLFEEIKVSPELRGSRHFSVLEDSRGRVWVGTARGLWLSAAGRTRFKQVTASDAATSELLADQIWSLHEDHRGGIWIGSRALGVARVTPGTGGELKVIKQDLLTDGKTVRAFATTPSGSLWVGTDGGGLIPVAPDGIAEPALHRDRATSSALRGNAVRALLTDRAGNLWIGTEGGLSRRFIGVESIWSLRVAPREPRGLSQGDVRAILVDRRGRIWLGQRRGSVDVVDLERGTLSRVVLQGAQAARDVQALVELPDGTILAGSIGVASIDPDTLQPKRGPYVQLDGMSIGALAWSDGRIWIATYDGLYTGQIGGALKRYAGTSDLPSTLGLNSLDSIKPLAGSIWLSGSTGLVLFDPKRQRFTLSRSDPAVPGSLPENRATAPMLAPNGNLWIGTSRGLATIPGYRTHGRLHFNTIHAPIVHQARFNALLIDTRQRIWGSLATGLVRYDPDSGQATLLREHAGLLPSGYIRHAAAVGPNGELLFGGSEGVTVVGTESLHAPQAAASLTVTRLYATNALQSPAMSQDGSVITLPAGARGLHADIALLDYRNSKGIHYSYRLTELGDQWTHVPTGRLPSITYARLPAGRFTLEVRAQVDGLTSAPLLHQASYAIVASPLWHETAAAKVAFVLLGVGALVFALRRRAAYIERRSARLRDLVDERTRELSAANSRLDELASRDALTGLLNRRRFTDLAGGALGDCVQQNAPLAVLLLDLDEFKRINDTFGHPAGDAVLRESATRLKQTCRATDIIGRWGGEEFIVCLTSTDSERALEVGERIRAAMAASSLHTEGRAVPFTASIGIAVCSPDCSTLDTLIARADAAMYAAKRAGRNRVVIDEHAPLSAVVCG